MSDVVPQRGIVGQIKPPIRVAPLARAATAPLATPDIPKRFDLAHHLQRPPLNRENLAAAAPFAAPHGRNPALARRSHRAVS